MGYKEAPVGDNSVKNINAHILASLLFLCYVFEIIPYQPCQDKLIFFPICKDHFTI